MRPARASASMSTVQNKVSPIMHCSITRCQDTMAWKSLLGYQVRGLAARAEPKKQAIPAGKIGLETCQPTSTNRTEPPCWHNKPYDIQIPVRTSGPNAEIILFRTFFFLVVHPEGLQNLVS